MKQIMPRHCGGLLAACLGLGLPVWLTGCNPEDAKNIAQDTGKIARDAGTAAGNAQLNDRVFATLAQRKGVDVSGLHLETSAGIVTISGHVRDANEKRIVKETAESIRGVNSVDVSKLAATK